MMNFSLAGKVAVVTGASRGIGEAIALAYARAGASVVLASRKLEGLEAIAGAIRAAGGEATPIATHMGEIDGVRALIQQAVERYGGIDIVVNNAATNPYFGPLLASEEGAWDKTFDVNLRGYFYLIREAAPVLGARGGGKVINMASIAGLVPQPGMGLYSLTKSAVVMLTKVLAVELAPQKIQVNAIAPGFIKTRFSQAIWGDEQVNAMVTGQTPAQRIGTVDDLTGLALYLASSASDFTTGQIITVDGGLTLVTQ